MSLLIYMSSFFRFKDRIPLGLRSRVVYKFKCQCCDALYFGETIRHLHTRISEHMGISACTGKPLSKLLPFLTFCLIINLLAILLILMIFLSWLPVLLPLNSYYERVYLSLNFNHRLMPIFDLYLWPCINSLLLSVCDISNTQLVIIKVNLKAVNGSEVVGNKLKTICYRRCKPEIKPVDKRTAIK